jgi:hypothetical protein
MVYGKDREDLIAALVRFLYGEEESSLIRDLGFEYNQDPRGILSDIRRDFSRFENQADFYHDSGAPWPCVRVRPGAGGEEYLSPVDIPELEVSDGVRVMDTYQFLDSKENRLKGLPIADGIPASEARRGFLTLAVSTTVLRASFFKIFGGKPKVTVTSGTSGELVLHSKGYFFSTAKVFGRTDVTQAVNAGDYCFYKSTTKPTTALPLYSISADTTISL